MLDRCTMEPKMVPPGRIELPTLAPSTRRSTDELQWRTGDAEGIRTPTLFRDGEAH